MKMNKIKYALFIGASLFTAACSEDLLDIPQKASTSADEFFAKDEAAQSLLLSCYAEMADRIAGADWSDGSMFGSPFLTALNYSADDVFSAGKNTEDHLDIRQFDEFRYDTKNSQVKAFYNRLYKVIFMCNQLKANIVGDTPAKKTAIAEARVMSAYSHMMAALLCSGASSAISSILAMTSSLTYFITLLAAVMKSAGMFQYAEFWLVVPSLQFLDSS